MQTYIIYHRKNLCIISKIRIVMKFSITAFVVLGFFMSNAQSKLTFEVEDHDFGEINEEMALLTILSTS